MNKEQTIYNDSYRILIEEINDVIFSVDEKGIFTFVSPVIEELLGYAPGEVQGHHFFDFAVPDGIERASVNFNKLAAGERDVNEYSMLSKTGNRVWVRASSRPVFIDGRFCGVRGILTDITVRKNIENQLQEMQTILEARVRERTEELALINEVLEESEERYRALFYQSPISIFIYNTSLNIIDCNDQFADIMHLTKDAILGFDLCSMHEEPVVTKLREALNGTTQFYEGSYRVTISDALLWVNITISPLRNKAGEVIGGIAAVLDVSERWHAEQALRESEERYRIISERTGQMQYDWDISSGKIVWDGAIEKITGFSPREFRSVDMKKWEEMIHPEDRDKTVELLNQAVRRGRKFSSEYRFITSHGSFRYIDDSGAFIKDDNGKVIRMLGSMKDVTERHEAEEHQRMLEARMQHTQKLESLGILAGGIAHDFNNLLMGIMGHADLALLDIPPDSKALDSIQEILHISRRAADLSRQMLAYSGRGRFVIESVDMREIVREITDMIEVSISKKANLTITYPTALPLIEADASQIRQVVMNLIINASEAIGDAPGLITVSMGSVECTRAYFSNIILNDDLREGVYVSFIVADTGQGMSEETRARIFDPFFTTKFTGRGLGLAAVIGIVRGHKGTIQVESSPGKGSTFTVLFPASERRRKKRKTSVEVNHDWQGNGTVLLVDDEESVVHIASLMLERIGFDVITAANGRGAIDVFREKAGNIVCVILDLTMPDMDGEQTFSVLQSINKNIPVVLSSGYQEQDIFERFSGKGFAGFLHKPYEISTLRGRLMEIFKSTDRIIPPES